MRLQRSWARPTGSATLGTSLPAIVITILFFPLLDICLTAFALQRRQQAGASTTSVASVYTSVLERELQILKLHHPEPLVFNDFSACLVFWIKSKLQLLLSSLGSSCVLVALDKHLMLFVYPVAYVSAILGSLCWSVWRFSGQEPIGAAARKALRVVLAQSPFLHIFFFLAQQSMRLPWQLLSCSLQALCMDDGPSCVLPTGVWPGDIGHLGQCNMSVTSWFLISCQPGGWSINAISLYTLKMLPAASAIPPHMLRNLVLPVELATHILSALGWSMQARAFPHLLHAYPSLAVYDICNLATMLVNCCICVLLDSGLQDGQELNISIQSGQYAEPVAAHQAPGRSSHAGDAISGLKTGTKLVSSLALESLVRSRPAAQPASSTRDLPVLAEAHRQLSTAALPSIAEERSIWSGDDDLSCDPNDIKEISGTDPQGTGLHGTGLQAGREPGIADSAAGWEPASLLLPPLTYTRRQVCPQAGRRQEGQRSGLQSRTVVQLAVKLDSMHLNRRPVSLVSVMATAIDAYNQTESAAFTKEVSLQQAGRAAADSSGTGYSAAGTSLGGMVPAADVPVRFELTGLSARAGCVELLVELSEADWTGTAVQALADGGQHDHVQDCSASIYKALAAMLAQLSSQGLLQPGEEPFVAANVYTGSAGDVGGGLEHMHGEAVHTIRRPTTLGCTWDADAHAWVVKCMNGGGTGMGAAPMALALAIPGADSDPGVSAPGMSDPGVSAPGMSGISDPGGSAPGMSQLWSVHPSLAIAWPAATAKEAHVRAADSASAGPCLVLRVDGVQSQQHLERLLSVCCPGADPRVAIQAFRPLKDPSTPFTTSEASEASIALVTVRVHGVPANAALTFQLWGSPAAHSTPQHSRQHSQVTQPVDTDGTYNVRAHAPFSLLVCSQRLNVLWVSDPWVAAEVRSIVHAELKGWAADDAGAVPQRGMQGGMQASTHRYTLPSDAAAACHELLQSLGMGLQAADILALSAQTHGSGSQSKAGASAAGRQHALADVLSQLPLQPLLRQLQPCVGGLLTACLQDGAVCLAQRLSGLPLMIADMAAIGAAAITSAPRTKSAATATDGSRLSPTAYAAVRSAVQSYLDGEVVHAGLTPLHLAVLSRSWPMVCTVLRWEQGLATSGNSGLVGLVCCPDSSMHTPEAETPRGVAAVTPLQLAVTLAALHPSHIHLPARMLLHALAVQASSISGLMSGTCTALSAVADSHDLSGSMLCVLLMAHMLSCALLLALLMPVRVVGHALLRALPKHLHQLQPAAMLFHVSSWSSANPHVGILTSGLRSACMRVWHLMSGSESSVALDAAYMQHHAVRSQSTLLASAGALGIVGVAVSYLLAVQAGFSAIGLAMHCLCHPLAVLTHMLLLKTRLRKRYEKQLAQPCSCSERRTLCVGAAAKSACSSTTAGYSIRGQTPYSRTSKASTSSAVARPASGLPMAASAQSACGSTTRSPGRLLAACFTCASIVRALLNFACAFGWGPFCIHPAMQFIYQNHAEIMGMGFLLMLSEPMPLRWRLPLVVLECVSSACFYTSLHTAYGIIPMPVMRAVTLGSLMTFTTWAMQQLHHKQLLGKQGTRPIPSN